MATKDSTPDVYENLLDELSPAALSELDNLTSALEMMLETHAARKLSRKETAKRLAITMLSVTTTSPGPRVN
jgi:hypothetical protein